MFRSLYAAAAIALGLLSSAAQAEQPQLPAPSVAEAMQEMQAKSAPLKDRMRTLLQERDAVLTAEQFDEAAYARLSGEIERTSAERYAVRNEVVVRLAKALPQAGRQELQRSLSGGYRNKPAYVAPQPAAGGQ
jgi:hypothetical protein